MDRSAPIAALAVCLLAACATPPAPAASAAAGSALGAFSISLAVKDLAASRAFYEQLGFAATGGDGRSWQVLRQGDTVIGLFQPARMACSVPSRCPACARATP